MALHICGDPHFSSLQPWRLPLGDAFLQWFEKYNPGPKDQNSFLCLGDYADGSILPGYEIAQLKRFIDIATAKFSNVYFLVGNHDLKLYKNLPQLSFEFATQDGVKILREPAEVLSIEGLRILSLPHYNYRVDIPTMADYYANLPQAIKDQAYDIVVGHFSDTSAQLFDRMIDISYLHASHIVLGHQHIRTSSHYTGSLFPCKISEVVSPAPRAFWVYNKEGSAVTKKEVPLPIFIEYKTVEYPKPLPAKQAAVTVYSIFGCESEKIAQDFYGDVFIKEVTTSGNTKKITNPTSSDDTFDAIDPVTVFSEWMKTAKEPVSRPVASIIKKLLAKNTPPSP